MSLEVPDFSQRQPAVEVDPQFWKRWSPRAFQPNPIPGEHLTAIFDAARWSPSSNNEQPWRFYTAANESPRFAAFLELLNEGNRNWARSASLLGFILSKRHFGNGSSPNAWARFDCGSAWMALTLQANRLGYHTHGMAGIKLDVICQALHVDPELFEPVCGFVIGIRTTPVDLPPPLQKREHPSPRRTLDEIWINQ